MAEEDLIFINTFKANPALAIECIKKVLSERKENQNKKEGESRKN